MTLQVIHDGCNSPEDLPFSGYKVTLGNSTMEFEEAREICKKEGHLVKIDTEDKQQELEELLGFHDTQSDFWIDRFQGGSELQGFWIGLVDQESEQDTRNDGLVQDIPSEDTSSTTRFRYVADIDNEKVTDPSFFQTPGQLPWISDQPDNNGNSENCVFIRAKESGNNRKVGWADGECSNSKYFVCQSECILETPKPTLLSTQLPSQQDPGTPSANPMRSLKQVGTFGAVTSFTIFIVLLLLAWREKSIIKSLKLEKKYLEDRLKYIRSVGS